MKEKSILIFPCGSETGLELCSALEHEKFIKVYGGSSCKDFGRVKYDNYIGDLPYVHEKKFLESIKKVVQEYKIDLIFPSMDSVMTVLKKNEYDLGCKVISSSVETLEICESKEKTFKVLKDLIPLPKIYNQDSKQFPLFIKPKKGYGSRGTFFASNDHELRAFFKDRDVKDFQLLEFLPGNEVTVDCFSSNGDLKYIKPRLRERIMNGISVSTKHLEGLTDTFSNWAENISKNIEFKGAWFFQAKQDKNGNYRLMEVAARSGGSSSINRGKGINLPLLTIYEQLGIPIKFLENNYDLSLERSLSTNFVINLEFSNIYCDYDDCLISKNKVNASLVKFLFEMRNEGKKLILLSKHEGNLISSITENKLADLFDEIIHIGLSEKKSEYIKHKDSIFIDDSFSERKDVRNNAGINVFSPDMISSIKLINNEA